MSYITRLAIAAAALAALLTPTSSTVTDCAEGKSLFQIQAQGFAPEPPVPGQDATLWIYYTIPESTTIDSGTCKYSFSLNGIPFTPTVEDLCTQVTCPLVTGTYNLSSTSQWPTGVSGKIVTKIEWYDSQKTLLLCSQTTERV